MGHAENQRGDKRGLAEKPERANRMSRRCGLAESKTGAKRKPKKGDMRWRETHPLGRQTENQEWTGEMQVSWTSGQSGKTTGGDEQNNSREC